MQQVELRSEEQDVLREVLHQAIAELEVEVFRTDSHEFKDMLKQRLEVLKQVASKVAAMAPVM